MRRRLRLLLPLLVLVGLAAPSAVSAAPRWEAVVKVNAGGPAVGAFEADTAGSPNVALYGDARVATWSTPRRGPTTAGDVPMEVFRTERFDNTRETRMKYRWRVPDGRYRVTLHFAEMYTGAHRDGARTYNVWAEGNRLLRDHDVHATAGARTTLSTTHEVEVEDGQLKVVFTARNQHPNLMAIEVDRRVGGGDDDPSPDPTPTPTPTDTPDPDPEPETPCRGVRIDVGDDWDRVLEQHPAGTTYCVAAGTHRLVQVVPQDGDRFVGAGTGRTIVSGAKDLSAGNARWTRSGNRWYVGGQDQTFERSINCDGGYCRLVQGGNPRHLTGDELFVDDERWEEATSLGGVDGTGEWFFDEAADRIWIGTDPARLGRIETSVRSGAFGGNGVRDVEISRMTIEKYATFPQYGAIGFWREHATRDWTLRDVEVANNAAGGITVGPGMTIDGCHVHHNGQIGIGGSAKDRWTGSEYTAPLVVRDCEISHSPELDFDWEWEAGATKIKHATDTVIERSWVHHAPTGIWFDVFNEGAVVRDNLVEDISHIGIFYEISSGPAVIERNMVRRVGDHTSAAWDDVETWHGVAGIRASNSDGVVIRGNSVDDAGSAIAFTDKNRGNGITTGLRNTRAVDNDVRLLERPGGAGTVGFADPAAQRAGNDFTGNTYRTAGDLRVFRVDGQRVGASTWRQRAESDAQVLTDGSRPGWPSGYRGPRGTR